MFISIEQIKAARALLGWTQKELAEAAGLNLEHVANYESGRSRALSTLEAIHQALVAQGVIFIDDTGVNKTRPGVRELRGQEGFAEFRADVLADSLKGPLDICVSNVDERQFDKWGAGKVNDDYVAAMSKIKTLHFRILIKEADYYLTGSQYALYRWLPDTLFNEISLYVYGDKVAIISFEENDFNAFVIHHAQIARFYRKEFDRIWEQAIEFEVPCE